MGIFLQFLKEKANKGRVYLLKRRESSLFHSGFTRPYVGCCAWFSVSCFEMQSIQKRADGMIQFALPDLLGSYCRYLLWSRGREKASRYVNELCSCVSCFPGVIHMEPLQICCGCEE